MGVKKYRYVAVIVAVLLMAACGQPPERASPTTAENYMSTLTWRDMDPMEVFRDRFSPEVVVFRPAGRNGEERELRETFPDGSSILVLARPCPGQPGLCVWAARAE